jgi:hypothetical protein
MHEGAATLLAKPFTAAQLFLVIRAALAKRDL